jgi:hypothetical protein
MAIRGRVQDGVVVPEEPGTLPEGAEVQIEVVVSTGKPEMRKSREGGMWKGQVQIADDFDQLPDEVADAFGMRTP